MRVPLFFLKAASPTLSTSSTMRTSGSTQVAMRIRTTAFASVCIAIVIVFAPGGVAAEPAEVTSARAKQWNPISIGAFADSISHVMMGYEGKKAPYEQYAPKQIVHIAENLLAWQNPDGGWPKNKDWTKILAQNELARLPHVTGAASSLDNRNTWSQIDYLARVHQQTRLKRYADAAVKGIEYILREQRRTGGWRGADVDAITFNDDIMVEVLKVLRTIVEDSDLYSFVGTPLHSRVKRSYEKSLEYVLKCQIKVGDRLTAWGQQHDHEDFRPVWARAFEPPSIVTAESVGVVRFLMSIDDPPPEIIRSIQSAVSWFDRVKIAGLRVKKVKAARVKFKHHWCDFDRVEIKDPQAPPIWTRFYDLETETPIFCTRNREITVKYTDLSRERRTGYSWYGYSPAKLLEEDYPKWQQKWVPKDNVLKDSQN